MNIVRKVQNNDTSIYKGELVEQNSLKGVIVCHKGSTKNSIVGYDKDVIYTSTLDDTTSYEMKDYIILSYIEKNNLSNNETLKELYYRLRFNGNYEILKLALDNLNSGRIYNSILEYYKHASKNKFDNISDEDIKELVDKVIARGLNVYTRIVYDDKSVLLCRDIDDEELTYYILNNNNGYVIDNIGLKDIVDNSESIVNVVENSQTIIVDGIDGIYKYNKNMI